MLGIKSHITIGKCRLFLSLLAISAFATAEEKFHDLPAGCVSPRVIDTDSLTKDDANKAAFPPLPLQIRTIQEPSVFASDERKFLVYELDIQNHGDSALQLHVLDIRLADKGHPSFSVNLNAQQLNAMLRPIGVDYWQYHGHPHIDDNRQLQAGRSVIAFLCLAFEKVSKIPAELNHSAQIKIANETWVADSAITAIHQNVVSLSPPLSGGNWTPRNGPQLDSHHRMGLVVFDGIAQNARRFAIDWRKSINGKQFQGDARNPSSYFAYAEKIFAVADGIVVKAADGFPDNIPSSDAGFEPALAMTRENLGGNFVIIALANGQFAAYFHMQPNSLKVKIGDTVKRGQLLGKLAIQAIRAGRIYIFKSRTNQICWVAKDSLLSLIISA